MKTRVAHVVLNLHAGGLESVVLGLIEGSDPDRFQHSVVVLEYPGRLAARLDGVADIVTVDMLRGLSMLHPAGLVRALRAIDPHAVHLHTGIWYKGSLGAARARAPFVLYTEHGRDPTEGPIRRFKDRLASRRTDLVVTVSEALERYMRADVVDPATPIVTLPNGIDTSLFRPRPGERATTRSALGVPPDAFVVGSVGRFYGVKGYDILLRAFAHHLEVEAEAGGAAPTSPMHLLIAGEGPEDAALRSLASELGIASRVHFLGWREDAPDLLPTFDLFAMTSLSEGTSMSLLEAMSCGVCPLVTDVGGNRAVVGPELAHRLVPSGDVEAFSAALASAVSDPASVARDGALGRQRVIDAYDRGHMVREYEALWARHAK